MAGLGDRAAPPPAAGRAWLALGIPGAGLLVVLVLMARIPDWLRGLAAIQGLFVAAFACYALALAGLRRAASLPGASLVVLAVAIAARAVLLPLTPSLSDDLYRYVWEGRVLIHGGNPYRRPPLDPALAPLRDARIFPAVNHPELATVYPPLAEAGFALVARISPTVAGFKLWVVLHDLALIALLGRLLARRGLAPAWALVYAWNPLVLIEYAGSGHNDPTGIVWLAAALLLAARRPALSGLALGVGALVKLAPLAALPFLWRRWPWRARLIAAAVTLVGLGWFWAETRTGASGLAAYWERWRNNELVFHYLERWTGGFEPARSIALALVGIAVAVAWWRRFEPARATRTALKTAVLVSPVAHPWYHGWWLALEPLEPSAPWIVLTGTAMLAYGMLGTPAEGRSFHLGIAGRWIEYGIPALLALALALARRARPVAHAAPEEV